MRPASFLSTLCGCSLAAAAILFLVLSIAPAAQAQQASPGISATTPSTMAENPIPGESASGTAKMTATAYGQIPPKVTLQLQLADSGGLTSDIGAIMRRALANAGYTTAGEAQLRMIVETTLVRGVDQDDPLGTFDHDKNSLYSSTRNTLLNPESHSGTDHAFRISLSVYDRSSGLYVWRGWSERISGNMTVEQASERMVPLLVKHLGQTLEMTEVTLQ